jgi:RecB family endonuclease NucS
MPIDFQKYKESLTRFVDVDIDQLESILYLAQQSLVNQSNDFQIPRDDDVDLVANKQQLEKTIQSIKDGFNYVDDEIAAESIKITIQYNHY